MSNLKYNSFKTILHHKTIYKIMLSCKLQLNIMILKRLLIFEDIFVHQWVGKNHINQYPLPPSPPFKKKTLN